MTSPSATEIVERLNLKAHPEGGFYFETFRDTSIILHKAQLPLQYKVDRPVSTSIYFLLPSGSISHLHRIPMAETWHFYLGESITVVELNEEDGGVKLTCLGQDVGANQQLQYTVPPNVWFGAYPTKDFNISPEDGAISQNAQRDPETNYGLVGCTCAPAFQFEDMALAKQSDLISRFPQHEALISILAFP